MKINNPFYFILNIVYVTLLLIPHISITTPTSLITGTIQFPETISTVPHIRIYSCGKKMPPQLCEVCHETKQFIFRVPQITKITKSDQKLHILITKEIQFESLTKNQTPPYNNTIGYLKIKPNQPYAFYELTLNNTKDEQDKVISSSWIINTAELDQQTRRIPDETIIICYDPFYIDSLSGGSALGSNAFALPTIKLKPDLLALLGSEHELQKLSNKILLSAIDSDTVHATITPKIKMNQKSHVTLVAPVV